VVKGKGEINRLFRLKGRQYHKTREIQSFSYGQSPLRNRSKQQNKSTRANVKSLEAFSIKELLDVFKDSVLKRNISPLTKSRHCSFIEAREIWQKSSPYKELRETELQLLLKEKESQFIEELSERIDDLERVYKMSPTKRNAEFLSKAREINKQNLKKISKKSLLYKSPIKSKKKITDESITEFVATKLRMRDETMLDYEEDNKPTDRNPASPSKTGKLAEFLKDTGNEKMLNKFVPCEKPIKPKGDYAFKLKPPI